jgi:hypothetical protein
MTERAAITSVNVSATPQELGRRAGAKGAEAIREVLSRRGRARVILATGVSMETVGGRPPTCSDGRFRPNNRSLLTGCPRP